MMCMILIVCSGSVCEIPKCCLSPGKKCGEEVTKLKLLPVVSEETETIVLPSTPQQDGFTSEEAGKDMLCFLMQLLYACVNRCVS